MPRVSVPDGTLRECRQHVDPGARLATAVTAHRRDPEGKVAGAHRHGASRCLTGSAARVLLLLVAYPQLEIDARGRAVLRVCGREARVLDRDPAVGVEQGGGDQV